MSVTPAAPRVVVSSGGTFHAYHLARGIDKAGWLHRFVTTVLNRSAGQVPVDRLVEIPWPARVASMLARAPVSGAQPLSYLVGDAWFDRAASRHLEGAGVFHGFNNQSLACIRAARRRGMVTIVERASAHPDALHALLADEFARYGLTAPTAHRRLRDRHVAEYDETDWVMVPSEPVRRSMVECGVPASKVRLLPLGVATGQFTPGAKRDDVFRVLFVGAISLQKGVPYLLEAFRLAALPKQLAELVLVGEPFPEATAFLPKYRGLFRMVRAVPQDRLAAEYQQGSVLVLPSLQEGFGMVAYEAAACGLPVIVSDHVGAEIRDGEDGFVVPVRNADAIAGKLTVLFEREDARRHMGRSARQQACRFTWERYHQGLAAHYRDLLGIEP